MFFKKRKSQAPSSSVSDSPDIESTVRQHLQDADDDTIRLVVAITGLLACVAYADREYSEAERKQIRDELSRVHGLSAAGADAICAVLEQDITRLASANTQSYTRDLRELSDLEMRREVLDVLVDLAAADELIEMSESDLLRRITAAMGLSADDYNASQARHRDRISLLK